MRRILLVLEDYNELLFLETLLKKVGFVVEGIRNETSLTERMMSFSPDLVIATGDGHKVNGTRVSKKVKKKGQNAKLLLLFPRQRIQNERALDAFAADGAVETPLNPRQIIASVCQLTQVPPEGIMAKFEKLPIAKDTSTSDGIQIISAKRAARPSGENAVVIGVQPEAKRSQKYADILKAEQASDSFLVSGATFSKQIVQQEMEKNKNAPAPPNWDEIDKERKKFVELLFKKK